MQTIDNTVKTIQSDTKDIYQLKSYKISNKATQSIEGDNLFMLELRNDEMKKAH